MREDLLDRTGIGIGIRIPGGDVFVNVCVMNRVFGNLDRSGADWLGDFDIPTSKEGENGRILL